MKKNEDLLSDPGLRTVLSENTEDPSQLGRVLAAAARIVSEGMVSKEVCNEEPGHYALCLLQQESEAIRELAMSESLTIGRASASAAAGWPVPDKWMSRRHFSVSVDSEGNAVIKDLDSKNGTWINDERLHGLRHLVRGDCIRAGQSIFLLL